MKNVLLITSTVAPAANTFLHARKDAALRLADYKASLEFQIELLKSNTIDSIIYVDNSGFPLDQLIKICEGRNVSKRVEFVSYKSDESPQLSRYFLEINLIKQAIVLSKTLSTDPNQRIWKLTGRYIVTNIEKIIRQAPDCDLYINCRNYPERVVDFYLTAFTSRGYTEILAADLEKYRNKASGEKILREELDTCFIPGLQIVKRFKQTPRILGIRGFDGAPYSGWKDTVKYAIRIAANRAIPAIWI